MARGFCVSRSGHCVPYTKRSGPRARSSLAKWSSGGPQTQLKSHTTRPWSCSTGTRRVGDKDVTVYTVSRDADQWHVTYLWRENGTLYTVSEHVAPPLTFRRVLENLDRIVGGLEAVEPQA